MSDSGLTSEVQRGGVGSRPAPSFPGRAPTGHRPSLGPQVRAPHAPGLTSLELRRAGGKAPGLAARGRQKSLPCRASGARSAPRGRGENPQLPAQERRPAPGFGWGGGGACSRERRRGAGRRGLGGAGKPADGGPRGGGRGGGPAGDAGKQLPPVAVRQPLTSGVFLKVNNKPAAAAVARADQRRPHREEGAGRRRRAPQRGAAREEAADPRPAPGRQGPEPPPAAASPRRRDPAPARAEFSGDELNL